MLDTTPRAGAARVRAAGATDTGRVRSGNEDRLHVDLERGIFLVVDGVGGHAAGEVASAIAVDVITQRLSRPLLGAEARAVREAIALANNEILTQSLEAPALRGMTCVLTVALLSERGMTVGHVGDTRLYRISAAGMVKLTHDHSPVGEREDAREISEVEAMRHPRRHEVFRDVGSVRHDPDDTDFIEVLEEPFDPAAAILLCSDGLTDMVSAASIERVIRQHAGDPARVVEALILAANEAGGRDNVTVVYLEGDAFASAVRVEPADGLRLAPVASEAVLGSRPAGRATWAALGLIGGLALGLALNWALTLYAPLPAGGGRTLVVGEAAEATAGSERFATIAAALAVAAPRDTVEIEPGTYEESVVLRDGVHLSARVPGTVVLTAREHQAGWVGVLADGRLGSRISGLVIRGRPEAPMAVGMRLSGHALQVDDVMFEGDLQVGVDIVNDGAITMRSSHFQGVRGLPLRIGDGARPVVRQSLFEGRPGASGPALDVAADATPDLRGNVFVGYQQLTTPSSPARLLDRNFAGTPLPGTRRAP